jgi:hypothetical protein
LKEELVRYSIKVGKQGSLIDSGVVKVEFMGERRITTV